MKTNSEKINSSKPPQIRMLLKFLVVPVILLMLNCTDSGIPFSLSKVRTQSTENMPTADGQKTAANFLAVGDIMLSRGVNRAIERGKNPLLPFSELNDLLLSSDFNFGNLESPVSGNNARFGQGLVFNTHTHDTPGLVTYNFKIVSLANNHALDQGLKGLRFTRKFLDGQGIKYLGVGENKIEAWQPKIIEANEIKIGFIGASYSSINDGGVLKTDYVARIEDLEDLKNSIRQLKNESDFIVVTMHAGIEYTRRPHRSQIVFARTAIDAGADLVIGSHPHWIQTFEEYRGRYIFYSLGNFIFDQRKPDTKEGLVLRLTLQRTTTGKADAQTVLEQIELIPVVIERLGIPRRATAAETTGILKKIGAREQVIFPPLNIK